MLRDNAGDVCAILTNVSHQAFLTPKYLHAHSDSAKGCTGHLSMGGLTWHQGSAGLPDVRDGAGTPL